MHCIMKEVTEWLEKKRWQNYPRFWSLVQDWLQSLPKLLNFSNFVELFLLAVCFYFLFSCTHFLETFFYYFFASMFAYLSSIKFFLLQFFFFFFFKKNEGSRAPSVVTRMVLLKSSGRGRLKFLRQYI